MFPGVDFLESVVDLGSVIDQELKMDRHIGKMSQSCFYHLRQLWTVRQSLSDTAVKMLINAFVVTRIDYCNTWRVPQFQTSRGFNKSWTQQLDCCLDFRNSLIFRQSWLASCIGFLPNSSCCSWWQVALLAGHHPIFVNSASWCRQFRDVGIFVLQTSFSSLCQDVTVLQHRNAVSQWLAHRRGIVCLQHCTRLLFNFHVDHSRRIWRHIYFVK